MVYKHFLSLIWNYESNVYFKSLKICYFQIYSGAKKYLVSHQLCKFSHLDERGL